MELRQIHYVLEVAKHKNFSKAAEALYVSQPAISQQIKSLEKELSITIFKRDTHGVSLTPDGERFISYANEVLDASDRLLAAFNQSTTNNKEQLKIGVFPFYKSTSFRKLFNSFFANTANVLGRIKVMENYESFNSISSGDIDFAIIKSRRENVPDDVAFDILESERLSVLVNKDNPNIKGDYIDVKDLGKFSLLTGENDSHFHVEMKEFYAKNNVEFNVSFLNTLETDMMIDMVEDGNGILLMTEYAAEQQINENIVALPIIPEQWFDVMLIYPKKRKLRGKALAFRNYIIDSYKPHSTPHK